MASEYGFKINVYASGAEKTKKELQEIYKPLQKMREQLKGNDGVYSYLNKLSKLDFSKINAQLGHLGDSVRIINVNATGLKGSIDKLERDMVKFSNTVSKALGRTNAEMINANRSIKSLSTTIKSDIASGFNSLGNQIGNVVKATDSINSSTSAMQGSFKSATENIGKMNNSLSQTNNIVKDVYKQVDQIKGGFIAWTLALLAYGWSEKIIESTSTFQALDRQLVTITGSTQKAKEQFRELTKLALDTPALDIKSAVSVSATFQRIGYSADRSAKSTEILANAVAKLSGGGSQEVERIRVQMEQLAFKTSGYAQDIKAMGENLPDIQERIREAFNVSSIEELSQIGVTGREVVDAIISSYSDLDKAQKTVKDSVETLHNAMMLFQKNLGEALLPIANKVFDTLNGISTGFDNLGQGTKSFLSNLTAFTFILNLLPAVGSGIAKATKLLSGNIPIFVQLKTAYSQLRTEWQTNRLLYTDEDLKGVKKLSVFVKEFTKGWKESKKEVENATKDVKKYAKEVDKLTIKKIRTENQAQTYRDAVGGQEQAINTFRNIASTIDELKNSSIACGQSLDYLAESYHQFKTGDITREQLDTRLSVLPEEEMLGAQKAFEIIDAQYSKLNELETTLANTNTELTATTDRQTEALNAQSAAIDKQKTKYKAVVDTLKQVMIGAGFIAGNFLTGIGSAFGEDGYGNQTYSTGRGFASIAGGAITGASTGAMLGMGTPFAPVLGAIGALVGALNGVKTAINNLRDYYLGNISNNVKDSYKEQITNAETNNDIRGAEKLRAQRDLQIAYEQARYKIRTGGIASSDLAPNMSDAELYNLIYSIADKIAKNGENSLTKDEKATLNVLGDTGIRNVKSQLVTYREVMKSTGVKENKANDTAKEQLEIINLQRQGKTLEAEIAQARATYNQYLREGTHTHEEEQVALAQMNMSIEQAQKNEEKRLADLKKQNEELANQKKLKEIAIKGEKDNLEKTISGNKYGADVSSAMAKYYQVLNDITKTEGERHNAWLQYRIDVNKAQVEDTKRADNEFIAKGSYFGTLSSDDTAIAKAFSTFKATWNDITADTKDKMTAFWEYNSELVNKQIDTVKKYIDTVKKGLEDTLRAREQYTNKVISEIERERNAQNQFFSQGQERIMATVELNDSRQLTNYTPEQVKKAVDNINFEEYNKKQAYNQVDAMLYGYNGNMTNTQIMENNVKQVDRINKLIEDNKTQGINLIKKLESIASAMWNTYQLTTKQERAKMAD